MKLPRFTLGIVTGFSLSLVLAALVFYFLEFPVAGGFYQSPTIPFYVTEDDPNYAIYKQLESREYWEDLSESAQAKAEKYCQQNNISSDIGVRCDGSPQGYEIYYSTGKYSSMHQLLTSDQIEVVIVDHVSSSYESALVPLIHGEVSAHQPATAP